MSYTMSPLVMVRITMKRFGMFHRKENIVWSKMFFGVVLWNTSFIKPVVTSQFIPKSFLRKKLKNMPTVLMSRYRYIWFTYHKNLHFNIFIFSCTKDLCIVMTAWIGHFTPFLSRSTGYGPENVLFVKCTQPGRWYLYLFERYLFLAFRFFSILNMRTYTLGYKQYVEFYLVEKCCRSLVQYITTLFLNNKEMNHHVSWKSRYRSDFRLVTMLSVIREPHILSASCLVYKISFIYKFSKKKHSISHIMVKIWFYKIFLCDSACLDCV